MRRQEQKITTDFSHAGIANYFPTEYVYGYYAVQGAAECIAYGYNSASDAVTGWMNSEMHKNILMNSEATKLIVARCGTYWVALTDN